MADPRGSPLSHVFPFISFRCLIVTWTFIITFCTLACLSLTVTLPNGEYAERYIDKILKQFNQDPQSFRHCPIIHSPLPPPGSNKEHYILPKLILWSPQKQFQIPMKCPLHGNSCDLTNGQVIFLESTTKMAGSFLTTWAILSLFKESTFVYTAE